MTYCKKATTHPKHGVGTAFTEQRELGSGVTLTEMTGTEQISAGSRSTMNLVTFSGHFNWWGKKPHQVSWNILQQRKPAGQFLLCWDVGEGHSPLGLEAIKDEWFMGCVQGQVIADTGVYVVILWETELTVWLKLGRFIKEQNHKVNSMSLWVTILWVCDPVIPWFCDSVM